MGSTFNRVSCKERPLILGSLEEKTRSWEFYIPTPVLVGRHASLGSDS